MKSFLLGVIVLSSISLSAADKIQPLDVKLGLWETTYTTATSGAPPIPPDMLAKITPEQKARMEAMVKQRQSEGPKTRTEKKCLTQEDLNKSNILGEDEKDCTRTVISSTSHRLEAKIECTRGGGKQSGTIEMEALDTTNVRGSVHSTMTAGGNTMRIDTKLSSKYLGSSCGARK
jgi:hypothetical protein